MPRLLLVDDNPSIHKIAETLLAGSDIALACAASGAQALTLLEQGEPFDVAMIDISMMGMSGWELLAHLRQSEATALMPIALMAGVLDVVDPEQLHQAPIQGFFKKPVELRDLADRVHRLLEIPVTAPVAAVPAPEPLAPPSAFATMPGFRVSDLGGPVEAAPAVPEDLLILGPEDLYPGEATTKTTEVPSGPGAFDPLEDSLDLEELDLESLRELTPAPEPQAAPQSALEANPDELEDFRLGDDLLETSGLDAPPAVEVISSVPDFAPGDTLGEPAFTNDLEDTASDLPDLFPAPAEPATPAPLEPELIDWTEDSDTLLAALPDAPVPQEFDVADVEASEAITLSDILDPGPLTLDPTPSALPALDSPAAESDLDLAGALFDTPEPSPWQEAPSAFDDVFAAPAAPAVTAEPDLDAAAEASVPAPAAPAAEPTTAPAPAEAASDPLAALLADPMLMDRLSKAVVARLSDQALREIAWEVMPELAERLQRN